MANRSNRRQSGKSTEAPRRDFARRRPASERRATAGFRGFHKRDGQIYGRRRSPRRKSRRAHHFGSPRARIADGAHRTDSWPGGTQRRSSSRGGRGDSLYNLPAAAWKIAALLDDSARLGKMREAALHMSKPNSAANIAQDALRLLD